MGCIGGRKMGRDGMEWRAEGDENGEVSVNEDGRRLATKRTNSGSNAFLAPPTRTRQPQHLNSLAKMSVSIYLMFTQQWLIYICKRQENYNIATKRCTRKIKLQA